MAVFKRSSSAVRSPTVWRKLRASTKVVLIAQGERRTILHHRGEDALRSYGDGTTMVPRLSCAAYAYDLTTIVARLYHVVIFVYHVCAALIVCLSEHEKVKISSAQAQAASQTALNK